MENPLTPDELKKRLKNVQTLPTIPPIVSKLNAMVEDEDVTALQLGEVIETDQVLTSKLLKMVNSSFFGFPQRISTVSNAIVLLGFNVIKTLIVTSSIFEVMQASDLGLWEHSLACATAAGILAKRRNIKNPEELSTAGLIHDLGKIVIKAELPEEYKKIQDVVSSKGVYMREAELEVLGVSHEIIGTWLIQSWNLPPRLVIPIENHHHPEEAKEYKTLSAICHFADILVRALGVGNGGDPWVPQLDHAAWERIKFSKSEMKDILKEMDEKLVDLEDFADEIQQLG